MIQPFKTAIILTFFLFIITSSLAQNIGGDVKMKDKTEFKVAYVNTTKLIQEYSEMMKVELEFTVKSDKVKKELDSLAENFQKEVQKYQKDMMLLTTEQRNETEAHLMHKQRIIEQQQKEMGNSLREESDVVIDSIVEKVKAFVTHYGNKNNYTLIFGSNESANIMYAQDGLDITETILQELNASYLNR